MLVPKCPRAPGAGRCWRWMGRESVCWWMHVMMILLDDGSLHAGSLSRMPRWASRHHSSGTKNRVATAYEVHVPPFLSPSSAFFFFSSWPQDHHCHRAPSLSSDCSTNNSHPVKTRHLQQLGRHEFPRVTRQLGWKGEEPPPSSHLVRLLQRLADLQLLPRQGSSRPGTPTSWARPSPAS